MAEDAYFVCATPRTGSTLLFEELLQTGVAGRPDEYFDDRRWVQLPMMERLGIKNDRVYFRDILRVATTANGVCGLKMHWHQMETLKEKILCQACLPTRDLDRLSIYDALHLGFRELRFIWLRRRNRVAQAISLWIASETRVWHQRHGVAPREKIVHYDYEAIDQLIRRIDRYEAHWESFFRRNGINPLMVVYEDFSENTVETVAAVLQHIGVRNTQPLRARSRLVKQSDDRSRMWEDFYRQTADCA